MINSSRLHNAKPEAGVSMFRQVMAGAALQNANYSFMMNERLAYQNFYVTEHFRLIGRNFRANQKTSLNLNANPDYIGNWQAAVKHAWEYEKLDIQLGGRGSENWTKSERAEILKYGKLRRYKNSQGKWDGAVGHHRSNKHDHPYAQSDAHNIRFCRDREQHLREEHGGDFHNETDGKWINRDEMVASTYRKGLLKRELYSVGMAMALGFASEATLSLIIELSQNGIDSETAKTALINAGKRGLSGAGCGIAYYGSLKFGGVMIDRLIPYMNLAPKTIKILKSQSGKIAVIGGVIIAADSIYQTTRDISNGMSFLQALGNTGKKQLVPIALLGISVWNPPVGIGASVVSVIADIWLTHRERKNMDQLELHYMNYLYINTNNNL